MTAVTLHPVIRFIERRRSEQQCTRHKSDRRERIWLRPSVPNRRSNPWLELDEARRTQQRHRKALADLTKLKEELAWAVTECRVAVGKPADEIAQLVSIAGVGLVIMTRRRGQGLFGPRQGSISYQVLTRPNTAVLALPSDKKWLRRAVSLAPKRT